MGKILFQEKQKFNQKWLLSIMVLANLSAFTPLIMGIYYQFYLEKPWGNQPMSDSGLLIVTILIMLIFLTLDFVVFKIQLETEIKDHQIFYKYFPFIQRYKSHQREEIESYYIKENLSFWKFGGYGYKKNIFKKTTKILVSGRSALILKLKNGKTLILGTNNPETLRSAMVKMMTKENDY